MFFSVLAEKLGGIDVWNYIGYVASVIVLISFLMTSVKKLRWVSAIGSLVFAIYGFMIGSIPTGILNAGVVVVNVYHLVSMSRNVDLFTTHKIRVENDFLKNFMMYNGRDIQKYYPGYTYGSTDADLAILAYCNMTAAGLLLGKDEGNGVLRVDLDYACPEYRDCRVGASIYQKLAKMGYHELRTTTENEKHDRYLLSMGFIQQEDGSYSKRM